MALQSMSAHFGIHFARRSLLMENLIMPKQILQLYIIISDRHLYLMTFSNRIYVSKVLFLVFV